MSTTTALAESKQEKPMEFVPFGGVDKIRLTLSIIQNIVCIRTKTGKTCSEQDAMRFMMLCQAQRLNPFAGDAFLAGYDGKNGPVFSLITAHVAFIKRAESCADFEGMESGIILCDDATGVVTEREGDFKLSTENCVGGWAKVYRKGRKPTYRRLSVAAMIPPYETPFWSEHKIPGQIVKCAEADALRATFPTLLGGLYSPEETQMTATVAATVPADVISIATAPQARIEAPASAKQTPQQELESLVIGGGFTFSHLQRFGAETGNITNADSLSGFDEIPKEEAQRLLRSRKGLLDLLAKIKEVA